MAILLVVRSGIYAKCPSKDRQKSMEEVCELSHSKTAFLRSKLHSSARIVFGRGTVMDKALGTTPEEEHLLGASKLAAVRTPFLNRTIEQNNHLFFYLSK